MLTHRVELLVGIEIAGRVARAATLRQARLADAYAAAEAVEVPADLAENTPARVAYQMAVDDAQILAQVCKLEGLPAVPALRELIQAIDPDDMGLLRAGAAELKKKLIDSRSASPACAGSKPPSSGGASA